MFGFPFNALLKLQSVIVINLNQPKEQLLVFVMKQSALWRLYDVLRTSGPRLLCDVLHSQDARACMIHWKDCESDSVQFGVVLLFVVWLITICVTG